MGELKNWYCEKLVIHVRLIHYLYITVCVALVCVLYININSQHKANLPANLALEAIRAVFARHMRRPVDSGEGLQAEVAKVGDAARRGDEVNLLQHGTRCDCGPLRYIIADLNNLSHK